MLNVTAHLLVIIAKTLDSITHTFVVDKSMSEYCRCC